MSYQKMMIRHNRPVKIVWGFMLENTYFIEFDASNHRVIEEAFRQRKLRQTSHYITIHDSHLPAPARIYFGVIQIHLRMPGTRYYVKRHVLSLSPTRIASHCALPPAPPTPSGTTALTSLPTPSYFVPSTTSLHSMLETPPSTTNPDPTITELLPNHLLSPPLFPNQQWSVTQAASNHILPEASVQSDPFLIFSSLQPVNTPPGDTCFLFNPDSTSPPANDSFNYVNTMTCPSVMP